MLIFCVVVGSHPTAAQTRQLLLNKQGALHAVSVGGLCTLACLPLFLTKGKIVGTWRPQGYSQGPGHREIVTQCRILAVGEQ